MESRAASAHLESSTDCNARARQIDKVRYPVPLMYNADTNNMVFSYLYLGTARGNVLRVQPAADFASSPVDILGVSNDTISALQVDYRRGYLYAATDNSKVNVTSMLFKISLGNFEIVSSLPLGPLNYDIRGSAIVDTEAGKLIGTSELCDSKNLLEFVI